MPKPLTSWPSKVKNYLRENPDKIEFYQLKGNEVFCKVCKKIFSFRKIFQLKQHDRTEAHSNAVKLAADKNAHVEKAEELENDTRKGNFSEELCNALIAAEIPLARLKNPVLRHFLKKWCMRVVPSQYLLDKTFEGPILHGAEEQSFQNTSDGSDPNDDCLPFKTRLCLICVSPIYSQIPGTDTDGGSDGADNERSRIGRSNSVISKQTFLRGISIFCRRLGIEKKYSMEEEWISVVGSQNFAEVVCCQKCHLLLKELVELRDLISRTEESLRENIKHIERSVVSSVGMAAEVEYCIGTCLQFRDAVIQNFNEREKRNITLANSSSIKLSVPLSSGKEKTRTLSKKRMKSKKVQSKTVNALKEDAMARLPFVKLEKMSSVEQHGDYEEAFEDGYSPIAADQENDFDFDVGLLDDVHMKNEEEEYHPKYGQLLRKRKRGRPPKQKPAEKVKVKRSRGRPPKTANMKIEMKPTVTSTGEELEEEEKATPYSEFSNSQLAPLDISKRSASVLSSNPASPEFDDGESQSKDDNYQPPLMSQESEASETNEESDRPKRKPKGRRLDGKMIAKKRTALARRRVNAASSEAYKKRLILEGRSLPEEDPFKDTRVSRADDPFNDRRTSRKVDKLLNEDSPYYLRPLLVVDAAKGVLSYMNCKIIMEPNRLVCQHPNCDFEYRFECFSTYFAFRAIKYHIKMDHRRVKSPLENEGTNFFFCVYCYQQFEKRFFLIQHIKKDHEDAEPFTCLCEVCCSTMPHNELLDHVMTHKNEEEISVAKVTLSMKARPGRVKDPLLPMAFPCDKCDIIFDNLTCLRIHSVSHVPLEIRKQHQCDRCPERFASLNSLRSHINLVHLKHQQPLHYSCHICGKKYIKQNKPKYIVHLRSHSGEKPYKCKTCGKGFREKYRVKQHELLHSDVKIQCEYCSNVYKSPKYLRRHHYKHHADIVQKPIKPKIEEPPFIGPKLAYPCEPCGRVYIYKSQLIPHLKHAHKMEYSRSSDYPNMITLEDFVEISKPRNRTPRTPSSTKSSPSQSHSSYAPVVDGRHGVFGVPSYFK